MNIIRGIDFVMGADLIFSPSDYDFADSDIVATCMGVKEKFLYSEDGKKTITQSGWTYKVYVPARDIVINVSVEGNKFAFDATQKGLKEVKFTNFRATFYVNRNNFLELSCKADKAELVTATTSQTI